MKISTNSIILLILEILSISYYGSCSLDYRLTTKCGQDVPQNCTQPGLLCETCSSLVLCIESSSNTYSKTFIESCASPLKCVAGACTTASDPICDGTACLDFPCNNVGVFPDPFDCKKHIYCVPQSDGKLKPYGVACETGYGFNSLTKVCDQPLVDNQCGGGLYPVDLCVEAGQNDAIGDNPSIYYVCKEYSSSVHDLYPYLYICPHGQVYGNFSCTDSMY